MHTLTSRTDVPAGEVCWRMSSRWREENYFRYARTHFALDALDSYAAVPDDPDRLVPSPARDRYPGFQQPHTKGRYCLWHARRIFQR